MFARTTRLLLRPGWAEDAEALAQAIGDEMIVRNLSTAPWPYALALTTPITLTCGPTRSLIIWKLVASAFKSISAQVGRPTVCVCVNDTSQVFVV